MKPRIRIVSIMYFSWIVLSKTVFSGDWSWFGNLFTHNTEATGLETPISVSIAGCAKLLWHEGRTEHVSKWALCGLWAYCKTNSRILCNMQEFLKRKIGVVKNHCKQKVWMLQYYGILLHNSLKMLVCQTFHHWYFKKSKFWMRESCLFFQGFHWGGNRVGKQKQLPHFK